MKKLFLLAFAILLAVTAVACSDEDMKSNNITSSQEQLSSFSDIQTSGEQAVSSSEEQSFVEDMSQDGGQSASLDEENTSSEGEQDYSSAEEQSSSSPRFVPAEPIQDGGQYEFGSN